MEVHLDQVLASCASSEHALRQLPSYGLQPLQLHQVAKATTGLSNVRRSTMVGIYVSQGSGQNRHACM